MLLTISTNRQPATDLGYLLHKHPDRCQTFELSFGQAHVFYPEATERRCTACLLLDVDPVGLVRGKGDWQGGSADQYVNDRPYVASSLMSVAISQVFGSALAGRSKDRADLVETPMPLTAKIDVLLALCRHELGLVHLELQLESGVVLMASTEAADPDGVRTPERLRVKSSDDQNIFIFFSYEHTPDENRRHDVNACLAGIFDQLMLDRAVRPASRSVPDTEHVLAESE